MCLKPNFLWWSYVKDPFNLKEMQYSRFKTTVLTHVIKLWRGSNIFSVSFSLNIYNFKITSAVWKDNYAHQSLNWETYPLNEQGTLNTKLVCLKPY